MLSWLLRPEISSNYFDTGCDGQDQELEQDYQAGTSTPTIRLSTDSAKEDELFSFEDHTTAESQFTDNFKSGA